jgi:hypothetical protein
MLGSSGHLPPNLVDIELKVNRKSVLRVLKCIEVDERGMRDIAHRNVPSCYYAAPHSLHGL